MRNKRIILFFQSINVQYSFIFRIKMATECGVCLEIYQDKTEFIPKLLPCSHTLCLCCLKRLTRDSQIQCPECRESHPVPTQGAQALPTNRYMLDYIDLLKKSGHLELRNKSGSNETNSPGEDTLQCSKHLNPCVMFCVDLQCGQLLCPECQIQLTGLSGSGKIFEISWISRNWFMI